MWISFSFIMNLYSVAYDFDNYGGLLNFFYL